MKNASKESNRKFNKQDLRANGLSLLPLALRPGLLRSRNIYFVPSKIRFTFKITPVVIFTLFSSLLFSAFSPTSPSTSAASLTLSIPNAISLNISPSPSGTFTKSSSSTLSLKSDANFGYTLSIKAKDSNNANNLVNGSAKIPSISAAVSETDFSSKGGNNTWGYQPSKLNSLDNSDFQPGPDDTEVTIDKTTSPNPSENNDYAITLAAKVDNTIPNGAYNNTFVLTAAANTVSYSITYNLNSGTGGPSPNPQVGNTIEPKIKLDSTAPTRENHEFKGWCTVETSDETCSGDTYQPGDDFTVAGDGSALTLHAMWKSIIPSMQNWTGCNDLGIEQTITLRDTRDDNTYTVSKLKDGKCWMTQNLKIVGDKLLTPEDSDIDSNFFLPASDFNSFGDESPHVYLFGSGGVYTLSAASAGSGATNNLAAQHSICAKGFTLPTYGEYQSLWSAYSNDLNMILSKFIIVPIEGHLNPSPSFGTGCGCFWSSTTGHAPGAKPGNNWLEHGNTPNFGFGVRCVSR